jgi:hypothetical protein
MLTVPALCLTMLLGQVDAPVSADAAVWRASLEARLTQNSPDVSTTAWLATPAARVNGEVITVGMVLLRYAGYLQRVEEQLERATDAQSRTDAWPAGGRITKRPLQRGEYLQMVQAIIERELPATIERMVIWQACRHELSGEEFAGLTAHLETLWNEQRLPELARELTNHQSQPVHANQMALIRETFFQEYGKVQYLIWKSSAVDPQQHKSLAREITKDLVKQARIESAYRIQMDPGT